jgi:glycine/D-amino acid oxidase-like deaminating enzyme
VGAARYRSRSLWLDGVDEALTPRPALPGDLHADVAIVGAGYTGLWTAYELLRRRPDLRVVVLEAEIAGFGASGRNGGWCSALFAGSRAATAHAHGREAAVAMERAMIDTIREVGDAIAREQIDAHWHLGGTLTLATSTAHVERLRARVADDHAWGFGEEDSRWMGPAEASERINARMLHGAAYTPHCARVHPARLARGLARTVERLGGTIFEQTRALEIAPRRVTTDHGTVRAELVVRATEGYTARLRGERRTLAPVYSLMIATEPLPDAVWDEIGWRGCETVADGRHLIVYGQRTADGRIAFGGRGAPYHYASRVRDAFDRDPATFDELHRILVDWFPSIRDAQVTHRWGGPLGVPRDWYSSVGLDRATGLAWAGGYVGDGVSTTNLAGRTLADLLLGEDTERTRLPWVQHRSRRWEPEPLRWTGINLALRIPAGADRVEARTGRPARWRQRLLDRVLGH